MKDPLLNPLFCSNTPDHAQDDGLELKLIYVLRHGPTNLEAFHPLPPICTNRLAGEATWIYHISTDNPHIAACKIGAAQKQQVQITHTYGTLCLSNLLTTEQCMQGPYACKDDDSAHVGGKP